QLRGAWNWAVPACASRLAPHRVHGARDRSPSSRPQPLPALRGLRRPGRPVARGGRGRGAALPRAVAREEPRRVLVAALEPRLLGDDVPRGLPADRRAPGPEGRSRRCVPLLRPPARSRDQPARARRVRPAPALFRDPRCADAGGARAWSLRTGAHAPRGRAAAAAAVPPPVPAGSDLAVARHIPLTRAGGDDSFRNE